MTAKKLAQKCDDDRYITANILVDISELINNDFEGVLDILSERVTGTLLLMDINYTVIDTLPDDMLVMQVSGDVSNIIEEDDDEYVETE